MTVLQRQVSVHAQQEGQLRRRLLEAGQLRRDLQEQLWRQEDATNSLAERNQRLHQQLTGAKENLGDTEECPATSLCSADTSPVSSPLTGMLVRSSAACPIKSL